MNTASYELIAASGTMKAGAAFIGGLIIVAGLIWAVRLGIKVRGQEPPRPTPEEQPTLPPSGPTHEMRERREPDEVPHAANESERLKPTQMHASGSKHADDQNRRRWGAGSGRDSGGTGPEGSDRV
ncbi:DUF6479 family protein [Streptomyces sp. NPDC088747]|uniref:DUF6479 family protein n=1 Tax=Streptomyces sp. NPDC088747 TaxID=3365886 RepID=UPI0038128C36